MQLRNNNEKIKASISGGGTLRGLSMGLGGPQGEKGETGAQGPKGESGAVGPKGDTGATGPAGPQGPKGDTGSVGPKGERGATGPAGEKGETGERGPAGADGNYTLPVASANTLGGIKVGANLTIDSNGVLSATGGGGSVEGESSNGDLSNYYNKQEIDNKIKIINNDASLINPADKSIFSGYYRESEVITKILDYVKTDSSTVKRYAWMMAHAVVFKLPNDIYTVVMPDADTGNKGHVTETKEFQMILMGYNNKTKVVPTGWWGWDSWTFNSAGEYVSHLYDKGCEGSPCIIDPNFTIAYSPSTNIKYGANFPGQEDGTLCTRGRKIDVQVLFSKDILKEEIVINSRSVIVDSANTKSRREILDGIEKIVAVEFGNTYGDVTIAAKKNDASSKIVKISTSDKAETTGEILLNTNAYRSKNVGQVIVNLTDRRLQIVDGINEKGIAIPNMSDIPEIEDNIFANNKLWSSAKMHDIDSLKTIIEPPIITKTGVENILTTVKNYGVFSQLRSDIEFMLTNLHLKAHNDSENKENAVYIAAFTEDKVLIDKNNFESIFTRYGLTTTLIDDREAWTFRATTSSYNLFSHYKPFAMFSEVHTIERSSSYHNHAGGQICFRYKGDNGSNSYVSHAVSVNTTKENNMKPTSTASVQNAVEYTELTYGYTHDSSIIKDSFKAYEVNPEFVYKIELPDTFRRSKDGTVYDEIIGDKFYKRVNSDGSIKTEEEVFTINIPNIIIPAGEVTISTFTEDPAFTGNRKAAYRASYFEISKENFAEAPKRPDYPKGNIAYNIDKLNKRIEEVAALANATRLENIVLKNKIRMLNENNELIKEFMYSALIDNQITKDNTVLLNKLKEIF